MTAVPMWAGSIDLTVGRGGLIRYQRNLTEIVGQNIDVTDLDLGSDVLPILMGHLNFVTGKYTGHPQVGDFTFAPGGDLIVSGCVDLGDDGDKQCDKQDFRGVLLTAKFLNAEIVEKGGKFFLEAEVLEQVNPKLAALLKLTKDTYLASLDLALVPEGHNRWELRAGVGSGDLLTVAEPSSIVILLLSLISFVGYRSLRSRTKCSHSDIS